MSEPHHILTVDVVPESTAMSRQAGRGTNRHRQTVAGCRGARFAAIAGFVGLLTLCVGAEDPAAIQLAALERAVAAAPEDLRLCAEYRQRVIELGQFDRSIKLLEQLASRPGAGPNVHISLALAYVDKVPVVTNFRRIFLGRDAMREASRAIMREPSPVAYYIRGLVALYYPEAVFHRARGGIADLEHVLHDMLPALVAHPSHARVYVSLGDGYWKVHDLTRAVTTWTDGLHRFPANPDLRERLAKRGADLDELVARVLDPARRVDTSLQELFAEVSAP